jgi:proteic killer suppression protein
MIVGFGNKLAEDLFHGGTSRASRSFPGELRASAVRKLQYLNAAATLSDLRVPPGNRLEALRGEWIGFYSIRINDKWRIVFRWQDGEAHDVRVVDYH